MLFISVFLILGLIVSPFLERFFRRHFGLTIVESYLVSFAIIFLAVSLLPVVGIPFIHLRTGVVVEDSGPVDEILVFSVLFFLMAVGLRIVRHFRRYDQRK